MIYVYEGQVARFAVVAIVVVGNEAKTVNDKSLKAKEAQHPLQLASNN